jgi:hypothetical protein
VGFYRVTGAAGSGRTMRLSIASNKNGFHDVCRSSVV